MPESPSPVSPTGEAAGEALSLEQRVLARRHLPCPRCRRGECQELSGRYVVTATYDVVLIAHSHDEAWECADDAKYDHRVESMTMRPDTADVKWPE